jgi:hypothetical protein
LPAKITPDKVEMVVRLRENGHTRTSAAKIANVSVSYIRKLETGFDNNGQGWREARKIKQIRGPIPYKDLCPEAKRAWDDIAYFARRYFGLVVMPYQVEAVGKIQEWLESDREEYVVINQPPGTGKSTFYTRVLPAWLTIRDRTLRGMIVSNSQTTADTYLIALRRRLEEPAALRASPQDLKAGIAVDAETSIIADFGLFKAPGADSGDKWSMKAFQVMQMPGYPPGDKEHTWQAFGQGGRFMGTRLDVIIADDVYDPTAIQTAEARQKIRTWFKESVESRIEPGGILLLVGQRLHADDIYRYVIDKKQLVDDNDDEIEDPALRPPMYHHVVYKAHYDELCEGDHRKDAPPWPNGCMLYPGRVSWRKMTSIINDPDGGRQTFAVQYQQEDSAPGSTLVDWLWVKGGRDPESGEEFLGCYNPDRGLWELPANLGNDGVMWASADPSPSKWWSIQAWYLHKPSERRFLVDHYRAKMGADDLLDYDPLTGQFSGIMDLWQAKSKAIGRPIRKWIVEANAAQLWLLQSRPADLWKTKHGVNIIKHNTHGNKSDPQYGVQASIPALWRLGRIDLPTKGHDAVIASKALVDEVTAWPGGATDDAVMAHWFGEWNLRRVYVPQQVEPLGFKVPSWLGPSTPERPTLRRVI